LLSALEAAAVVNSNSNDNGDVDADINGIKLIEDRASEEYSKALKPFEGKQGIPKREEAALQLQVQVVQQSERGGDWIPLGDVLQPLVYVKAEIEEKDKNTDKNTDKHKDKDKKIACETATLEVRLRSDGIVVTGLDQHGGVSVVQALKNSRMGALQWYATLVACIVFFGGFLLKSYWEDVVFERDTRRVLAFYRRAVPGSMHDGDEHGARYLVYKYRHKKPKLWVRLEKKYEYAVPTHAGHWDSFVKEVELEMRIEKEARQAKAEARERGEWNDSGDAGEEENLDNDNETNSNTKKGESGKGERARAATKGDNTNENDKGDSDGGDEL
jgi:hypothetical protein